MSSILGTFLLVVGIGGVGAAVHELLTSDRRKARALRHVFFFGGMLSIIIGIAIS